jgi:hypothetical protein
VGDSPWRIRRHAVSQKTTRALRKAHRLAMGAVGSRAFLVYLERAGPDFMGSHNAGSLGTRFKSMRAAWPVLSEWSTNS